MTNEKKLYLSVLVSTDCKSNSLTAQNHRLDMCNCSLTADGLEAGDASAAGSLQREMGAQVTHFFSRSSLDPKVFSTADFSSGDADLP